MTTTDTIEIFGNTLSTARVLSFLALSLVLGSVALFLTRKLATVWIHLQLGLIGGFALLVVPFLIKTGATSPFAVTFSWFDWAKTFDVTFGLDHLGSLMLALVLLISFVVVLYSTAYMKGEEGYGRYFACLMLFSASMLGIILSFNLLMTFVFWELVGFCSYLLINFWYRRPQAAQAARKAFIANRIGDLGFLLGLGLLYSEYGTLEIPEILHMSTSNSPNPSLLYWAGFGIFMGCVGKSAQFPLLVWLPDAMQAPTPISALLHAATMVAAGVFLLARTFPLLHPELLTFIAYVGAITSLIGAFSAASQTDIKKVLAYSTISQLGYMIAALGAHSYFASIFHLITHAMFKACLFLCAGAIIHSMSHLKQYISIQQSAYDFDPQDIRLMGGLRKRMPFTFVAFLLASLAGAGVPLSAGFLSKDEILASVCSWAALQSNALHLLLPVLIYGTSLMTAFYTGRMFFLVFFGGFRLGKYHPSLKGYSKYIHEAPPIMLVSYLLLSVFTIFVFYSFNPVDPDTSWLVPFLAHPTSVFSAEMHFLAEVAQKQEQLHYWVISFSIVVLSLGFGLSYVLYGFKTKYKKKFLKIDHQSFIVQLSRNTLFLNNIYQVVFIRPFERLSSGLFAFDTRWVDGIIKSSGVAIVTFSHFWSWVDHWIVDGFVNASMWLLSAIGKELKQLQNGKIQSYLLVAFFAMLLAIAWMLM